MSSLFPVPTLVKALFSSHQWVKKPSGRLVFFYGKSPFFIEANGIKKNVFFFSVAMLVYLEGLWFPRADETNHLWPDASDARQLNHRQRGVAQPRIRPKVLATRRVNMDGSSSDLPNKSWFKKPEKSTWMIGVTLKNSSLKRQNMTKPHIYIGNQLSLRVTLGAGMRSISV